MTTTDDPDRIPPKPGEAYAETDGSVELGADVAGAADQDAVAEGDVMLAQDVGGYPQGNPDRGEIVTGDTPYRFSRKLKVLSEPAGVESSALGALRNHLTQQHLSLGRRSLAICSVSENVDRSLVSASLAVAAAQSGLSTILIDANLRQPGLDQYFTPPYPQPGLSEYLAGKVNEQSAIIANNVLPNLSLIPAGAPPEDPQSLLSQRRLDDLVGGLMRSYDLTIVDCAASRHSSDARRVAAVLRYALIVVKRDVTYVSDLKRLVSELSSDRVTVIGTFLNVD